MLYADLVSFWTVGAANHDGLTNVIYNAVQTKSNNVIVVVGLIEDVRPIYSYVRGKREKVKAE